MKRICSNIFLSFCIIYSIVAQPIKYPELKLIDSKLIIPAGPIISYTYQVNFDLQLTEVMKKAFEGTSKEIEDFIKKFEEKRKELEAQYEASSGESKIQNAYNLIEFIIESRREWDRIIMPNSNLWEGTYSMNMDVMGIARASLNGLAKINLSGMSVDSIGMQLPKILKGEVKGNGETVLNFSFGNFFDLSGGGTFNCENKLSGFYELLDLWIARHYFFTKEGSFDLFGNFMDIENFTSHIDIHNGKTTSSLYVIGPLVYGEINSTNETMSGYMAYLDLLTGTYIRKDINEAVEHAEQAYELNRFRYIHPEFEELDFQKYLDQYFKYYVTSIDDVRKGQYTSEQDIAKRKDLTFNTLNELINAEKLGHIANVSENVYFELKLIPAEYGSLYDNWFKMWFNDTDKYWENMVGTSQNEDERINNLKNRLNNVLIAILFNDLLIVSDELMAELELYEGSNFISNRIKDYFKEANEKYCRELSNHRINEEEYSSWHEKIIMLAKQYGNSNLITFINSAHC